MELLTDKRSEINRYYQEKIPFYFAQDPLYRQRESTTMSIYLSIYLFLMYLKCLKNIGHSFTKIQKKKYYNPSMLKESQYQ